MYKVRVPDLTQHDKDIWDILPQRTDAVLLLDQVRAVYPLSLDTVHFKLHARAMLLLASSHLICLARMFCKYLKHMILEMYINILPEGIFTKQKCLISQIPSRRNSYVHF